MNCQEVMIDMQRQLDGDLDEFESEALNAHLRQCSQCAAMYERLQSLTVELANLPKVMPRYSLVDAILPQLEQIDKQQAQEREMSAQAAPLETGSVTDRTVAARRRLRDRFSIRALSGVIAAGVVVGLFLVTYDSPSGDLKDGNVAMESSTADNSAADMAANSEMAAPEARMAPNEKNAPAEADSYASSANGGTVEQQENAAASGEEPTVTSNLQDQAGEPTSKLPAAGSNDGKADQHEPAPADDGEQMMGIASAEEPSAKQDMSGDVVGGPEQGITSFEVADGVTEPDTNKMAGAASTDTHSLADEAVDVALSPDGVYRAAATASVVTIYDAAADIEVYRTKEHAGEVRIVSWSPDSQYLEYEVSTTEGVTERYKIDLRQGIETKV